MCNRSGTVKQSVEGCVGGFAEVKPCVLSMCERTNLDLFDELRFDLRVVEDSGEELADIRYYELGFVVDRGVEGCDSESTIGEVAVAQHSLKHWCHGLGEDVVVGIARFAQGEAEGRNDSTTDCGVRVRQRLGEFRNVRGRIDSCKSTNAFGPNSTVVLGLRHCEQFLPQFTCEEVQFSS